MLYRYKYEEMEIPWLDGSKVGLGLCNPKSSKPELADSIKQTNLFEKPVTDFIPGPFTFKVSRPPMINSPSAGEEILELKGKLDWTIEMRSWCAWAFLPDADYATTSWGCAELLECTSTTPHISMST